MSKETIPQSIVDIINKKYPIANRDHFMSDIQNTVQEERREAAEFGYGLSEGRIKELEEKVGELTQDNMTHEYNNAESERFYPQLKEQIIEEYKASDKRISVKDGLPDELVDVLVCMKRFNSYDYYLIVADYYEGKWNAGDKEDLDNNLDFYAVTHYQYLPKPPKSI